MSCLNERFEQRQIVGMRQLEIGAVSGHDRYRPLERFEERRFISHGQSVLVRVGKGIGHFFGAMEIDGFIDKDEFKKQIDEWIHVFRNTKPAPGTNGPLIPGDPEREAEAIRSKDGIPLIKPVVDDLLDIARKTGIPFEIK